jgi:hypothetical protein
LGGGDLTAAVVWVLKVADDDCLVTYSSSEEEEEVASSAGTGSRGGGACSAGSFRTLHQNHEPEPQMHEEF